MFLYRQGNFVLKIVWATLNFVDSWPEQSSCRVSENCFTVSEKSGKSEGDFLFQWVAILTELRCCKILQALSLFPLP